MLTRNNKQYTFISIYKLFIYDSIVIDAILPIKYKSNNRKINIKVNKDERII